MKIFRNAFCRKASPPPLLPSLTVPHADVSWSEISSAVASAGIHIRGEDVPTIVDIPGYGGFKYEPSEAKRFLSTQFPDTTDAQLNRALRFLNSRVIAAMRHADAAAAQFQSPRKRWSAVEW